uniref:Coatomer subunit epsilon n=1 Tax=Lynceus sp. MCZ IZ 141354 TaxID=1930659 RepID=A0A9N6WT93_9CRUS|nr:EOG090X0A8E [Lynceus sp. MCZ IZ 141354]
MARQQSETDELYEVKANFFIGNYQASINEAQKVKSKLPEVELERDVFLYRAYLAQKKYGVVSSEIHGGFAPELQSLKLLADYLASPAKRESIVSKIDQQMNGTVDLKNYVLFLSAATIYFHEQNYETCLKVLHQSDHLECRALMVQTLLKMDRVDLAKKELKTMQEQDDDSIVTQLAGAWVNLAIGGDKLQEAYYTFQELIDKHVSTSYLLNGQATAYIGQGKYEEAESALQEALEKDSNNSDTLVNLIVLSQLTGKTPEVCSRYVNQLKDSAPQHPFIQELSAKEREFERLAAHYVASA